MAPIYLDYAASTPVDPAVVDAVAHCLGSPELTANPSADHEAGRRAAAIVENARADVADLIGAGAAEIVWTSGATESNNLGIIGTARFLEAKGRHIVTSLSEHRAVLECCRHLEMYGWRVTWLRPDDSGIVAPEAVDAAIATDTVLVSLMHVNNETGVVQDVGAIGAICRRRGVLFHVDAAQSAGRVPIDVRRQSVDLLSLSAQKMYGPKGVGALFLDRSRVRRIEPLFHGGGQERGLRPGTVATHQVAGMAAAARLAGARLTGEAAHVAGLHDRLWSKLRTIPGVTLNGDPGRRTGHILNVSVAGVEGESLLHGLRELAVASGAACSSATGEPSYVLRLLGRSPQLARSSIRFSFGRPTTAGEIDAAAAAFKTAVEALRARSPAWPPARARLAESGSREDAAGRPEHAGRFRGEGGSEEGGVWVVCHANIAAECIQAIDFEVFGCPAVMTLCATLADRLRGQPVSAAAALDMAALRSELGIAAEKTGKLLIVEDALRNCLADWDNSRLPNPSRGAGRGGQAD